MHLFKNVEMLVYYVCILPKVINKQLLLPKTTCVCDLVGKKSGFYANELCYALLVIGASANQNCGGGGGLRIKRGMECIVGGGGGGEA